MLYVPFFADFFCSRGPQMCFRGGQRSMIKDHIFTFFLPFPIWKWAICKQLTTQCCKTPKQIQMAFYVKNGAEIFTGAPSMRQQGSTLDLLLLDCLLKTMG